MHFFNSFGAAHQFQEATSFPEVTGNEIESRHGNPRCSLGTRATRSPDRPLRINSWPSFVSFRCCGSLRGDCAGRGARESERTIGARQIAVTVGSMSWIISRSRWPCAFDPLLAHRATESKKTDFHVTER